MSKIYWFMIFGVFFASMPSSAVGIDLSRLYGHYKAPVKRSGKYHLKYYMKKVGFFAVY